MITTTRRRIVLAATAGVLALGGLGATAALAETPSAHSTAGVADSATRQVGAEKGERKRVRHLARALHAQAVLTKKDGSFVTVVQQRGEVTAVSADGLTVKSVDGYTATYRVDTDVRVRKDGEKTEFSAIRTGDRVLLFGVRSGDTQTVKAVLVPKAEK